MRKIVFSVAILGVGLLATSLSARTARSASYSFDYSVSGLGGGISQSADYFLVSVADDNGMAVPSSSTSHVYTIEPAVGSESKTRVVPAAAKFWNLY